MLLVYIKVIGLSVQSNLSVIKTDKLDCTDSKKERKIYHIEGSLYTDVVLFFFSFFSKTSASEASARE